jgi:hypothetical protein
MNASFTSITTTTPNDVWRHQATMTDRLTTEALTYHLWMASCAKAVALVRPATGSHLMTGGDRDYPWRVMMAARALYMEKNDGQ